MSDNQDVPCVSQNIKFSLVTDLLTKIHDAKDTKKKSAFVRRMLSIFQDFTKKLQNENTKQSFYPVLRLLLPDCDYERGSYGIKEATFGRLYVRVLGIEKKSPEAKVLLEGHHQDCKDYGEVVCHVMNLRSRKESEITVFEVNKGLDLIVQHFQNGHMEKIDEILIKFISEMTAPDQKWLTRIILKRFSLGIGKNTILKILHPDALAAYNSTNKLSAACDLMGSQEKEKNPPEASGSRPREMESIKIFSPVKPMLLNRIALPALSEALKEKKDFFIETKMDGERFQLHRSANDYRYFSRNGFDYSEKFGRDFASGSITPYIHSLFAKKVQNIILDGEMMVWNRQEEFFYAKGDNYDVKNISRTDPLLKVVYVVYDILFLNGENLTRKPYAERRRLLSTVVAEKRGALERGSCEKLTDFEHLIKCFNEAVDRSEEGIVIKELGSHYRPNERSNQAGWFKIKPDYIDGAVTDLDLLIIGGYYNKTKSYIESYLLGVYSNGPGERSDPLFHSVGKVSARGLKFDERCQLNYDLRAHWRTVEKDKMGRRVAPPECLEWKNSVPDVWIEPSKSLVLEVKATELTRTDTYRTTHALKFPRIVAVRRDKPWCDSCTLAEFEQLCGQSGGKTGVQKLTKRHITRDDAKKAPTKRQKTTELVKKLPDPVKKVSAVFQSLNFCVLSTKKTLPPIDELREMIVKHGGQIVENPGRSTYAIIAGDMTLNVRKYAEKKIYNIVRVEWLVRSVGGLKIPKTLPKFHPSDMLSCTPEMQDYFTRTFDEFGDSFTESIDPQSLREFLEKMHVDKSERLLRREMIDFEREVHGNRCRNIFRPYSIHFYDTNNCQRTKLAEIIFKSRHGSPINDFSCNFIAINPSRWTAFKEQFPENTQRQVVSIDWIKECHCEGKILEMTNFLFN